MISINLYLKSASVVIFITTGYAKPFLYKPSQALSLVISSSSTPQQPSNIADLRKSKIEQLSKLQESENQSFFDDGQYTNESTPNEVIPGIVQKKIAKLFTKLQILSSLTNNNNGDKNNTNEQNIFGSNDEEALETLEITTDDSILAKGNYSANEFEKLRNFEDVTSTVPPRPLNFMPITLARIFESIVSLAYRTLSSPPSKGTVSKTS